jgi:hypothetical protein
MFLFYLNCYPYISYAKKVELDETNLKIYSTEKDTTVLTLINKKNILTSLKGSHKLESISGFMGANTMFDYGCEKGEWWGYGSSIYNATRTDYDIDLSKEEINKLKTMTINISEDLTITVLCKGKEYFKVPYKEDGMGYFLNKPTVEYFSVIPSNLKPSTLFLEDNLYLFAQDNIQETELDPINIAQHFVNAVLIVYNTKSKHFEMTLFNADCCDSSVYTFN